ncbi:hypothetical protein AMECASPLE_008563 [Ameca splendens]|uniref:Secreted protein n=1 Tax=Ameca splendens TaxID=208324 RepID=A0ABV0ZK65_9TELE
MILGCLSASSLSAALATEIAFTCSFSVCSQSDLTRFTCTSGFKSRTPRDRKCQIFKSLCIFLLCLAHIGYLTGFCFLDTTLPGTQLPDSLTDSEKRFLSLPLRASCRSPSQSF